MGEIQFIVLIIVLAFAQWLFSHLIKVSLEKSIQHKYEKRLEDHKFNQIQKQKAESVARLFARWIKYRGHEEKFLDTKELIEYYEEITRMSFEIALWLKDNKLLKDIMERLKNAPNARNINEIILDVRKLILDSDNPDDLIIVSWPKEHEEWFKNRK